MWDCTLMNHLILWIDTTKVFVVVATKVHHYEATMCIILETNSTDFMMRISFIVSKLQ